MKEHVFEILKALKAGKEANGHSPTHVTRQELNEAINTALNDLFTEGRIDVGNTINDKWIDPTK